MSDKSVADLLWLFWIWGCLTGVSLGFVLGWWAAAP